MPTPAFPSAVSAAPRAASPNAARPADRAQADGFDAMVRSTAREDARPEPSARHSAPRAAPADNAKSVIADSDALSPEAGAIPTPPQDQPQAPKAVSPDATTTDAATRETDTAQADASPAAVIQTATVSVEAPQTQAQPQPPVAAEASVETASTNPPPAVPASPGPATTGEADAAAPAPTIQTTPKGADAAQAQAALMQAMLDAEAAATPIPSDGAQEAPDALQNAALPVPRTAAPSNAAAANPATADARADNAGKSETSGQNTDQNPSDGQNRGDSHAATLATANAKSDPAGARAAAPAAVMAQLLDTAAPDAPPPAAGQPAATATASAPAIAVTAAGQSGLSHVNAQAVVHLAAQITKRLEGRSTQFDMSMTPEGLGRVDVSLDIDADGQLAARLAFDNPLAATDMKGRADELRRQLEDAGFTLAQDALDFSQRDGSAPGGGFDRRQSRAFANASRNTLDADIAAPALAQTSAWMSLTVTPQGVDMKV